MKDAQFRRWWGALFGAGLGLIYGLASQTINRLALPGVPLYQPPLGWAGNVGLYILGGMILGLATAWLAESVLSIFLGGAVGAAGLAVYVVLITGNRPAAAVGAATSALAVFAVTLAGLVLPLALYRWVVNRQVEARINAEPILSRLWLPLILLLAAGGAGGLALHSPLARTMLVRANDMILAGRQAPSASELPVPLQAEYVEGFLERAVGSFTLEWSNDKINRFGIARPMTERPWEEAVVIARFENEWTLVCLFPAADAEPRCKGFGGRASSFAAPPRAAPDPFQAAWDDRQIFETGLVKAEQGVLSQLPGASVYHIDLEISSDLSRLQGRQQVRYTNRQDRALEEIYFRLFPNTSGGQFAVAEVRVDGQPVEPVYEFNATAIRVPLVQALQPGKHCVIEMNFSSHVPHEMGGNYGLFVYYDGVLALDEFYPVIPVYDDEGWNVETPPPNGDTSYFDASFYLVRVTAPARLTVVASGIEVGRERQGDNQVLTFAAGPARDFYLAASERYTLVSRQVGETTVNSCAPVERVAEAEQAARIAAGALQRYNARLGVYPYTELDVVSTPMTALGIEYPGVVGITLRMYDPQAAIGGSPASAFMEGTTAHEVAHQWFYNVVGNDQVDEPWLDEAVVQYVTGFYYLDTYGREGWQQYRYYGWVQRWQRVGMAKIPIGLPAGDYAENEYSPIVYGRGPLFLEQLADKLGQETFDEFLRDYYASHKWGIGTTPEFKQLAEQYCQCDLTDLFEAWVYAK